MTDRREMDQVTEVEALKARLGELEQRLNEASGAYGGVTLCAVTKTVPADTVNAAIEAGVRLIGENRVQELVDKLPLLRGDVQVHLIGRLQTNKVKYLPGRVSLIQSLDRIELARAIDRAAQSAGIVMDALIQVNIGREPQKGGVDEDQLDELIRACDPLEGLRVRGLMAVMPQADDPEQVRPLMRRMRSLFDARRARPVGRADMEILSMGMSHDCFVAAEEGATMVRVGTALFGQRPAR